MLLRAAGGVNPPRCAPPVVPNPFGIRYATHRVTFPCGYSSCLREDVLPRAFWARQDPPPFDMPRAPRVQDLACAAPLVLSALDVWLERRALRRTLPLLRSYPRNSFPFPPSCIPLPRLKAATRL